MSIPIRTCAGCRRRAPKAELARFVARDGELVADPARREPGRGVYTCRRRACFEQAVTRRAFPRALRTAVHVPHSLDPFGGTD